MFDQFILFFKNAFCSLLCLYVIRIFVVYFRVHKSKYIERRPKSMPVKVMIPLGSGGHTFEMFRLIQNLGEKFYPRIYIIAESDSLSEQKAKSFEESKSINSATESYVIEKILRSREVGQSWISTCFTTLKACFVAFVLMIKHKPDLVLCNGPGTCVPICVIAYLFHVLGWKHVRIVYVESICRVKTMSLSGKILYYIADRFFVQWPQLKEKYPHAKYIGKLI